MHNLVFITGASGSGKTTIVKELEKKHPEDLVFCYFDSIGVPSPKEMEKEHGSQDEWQRQATSQWVQDIQDKYSDKKANVILDGQMRIAYILEACRNNGINLFQIILVDCNDIERRKRLVDRGHPELSDEKMMNWAKYLRVEADSAENVSVLDTSDHTIEQSVERLDRLIQAG